MNYKETVEYLFSQLPMYQRQGDVAFKKDLKNIIALTKHIGNPQEKFRSIHIAGTNGKGSVSHILASVLQTAGYKVGLYTSPHLKDFRERIKINGIEVPENFVIDFVENNMTVFNKIKPSFFEMSVAMAFDYFAKEEVDFAVIETGMGGRLDSTNILHPILSVITNISIDHTQHLGDTVEKIAGEKAGIIKYNVPVVIGETSSYSKNIFLSTAELKEAPLYLANYVYSADYSFLSKDYKQIFNIHKGGEMYYPNLKTDLLGLYQKKNVITALQCIEIMKDAYKISKENIYDGILNVAKKTALKGRWQILGYNPLIVCDTGHNEAGIAEVVKHINVVPHKKLHFVFGTVNDKKLDNILRLLPKKATYYFTKANIPRAMDENELAGIASKFNLRGNTYPTVSAAFSNAKNNAEQNDLVFVGGSTFVVAEVL